MASHNLMEGTADEVGAEQRMLLTGHGILVVDHFCSAATAKNFGGVSPPSGFAVRHAVEAVEAAYLGPIWPGIRGIAAQDSASSVCMVVCSSCTTDTKNHIRELASKAEGQCTTVAEATCIGATCRDAHLGF